MYHTKLWTPVPPSNPKLTQTIHHTQSPQLPCKNPWLIQGPVEIYFFHPFPSSPQVAFPCKMPDVTPEGNLGAEAPSQRGSPGT